MPNPFRILTHATLATALGLGLLIVSSTSQAKVITFGFSGQLLGDSATGEVFETPLAYSGRYSFNDDASNFSLNPQVGEYVGNSFELDFGTTHFETPLFVINAANDLTFSDPPTDAYLVEAFVGFGMITLGVHYDRGDIFSDVSLPLTAPALTDALAGDPPFLGLQDLFPDHEFVVGNLQTLTCLSCGDGGGTATPVAEPQAWSLALVAGLPLLAFGFARRRRQTNEEGRV